MSGKIICVANRKGGVGKTTVAVLLAQGFQAYGKLATLVIDVDPQASATYALAGEEMLDKVSKKTLLHTPSIRNGKSYWPQHSHVWGQISALTDAIDTPLALLGASPDLWTLEDEIKKRFRPDNFRTNWRSFIKDAKSRYGIIIIDTPPGNSFFGDLAIESADLVVVPCDATPISVRAMSVFCDQMERNKPYRKHIHNKSIRMIWTKFRSNQDGADHLEAINKSLLSVLKERHDALPPKRMRLEHIPHLLTPANAAGEDIRGLPSMPILAELSNSTAGQGFDQRYPVKARGRIVEIVDAAAGQLGVALSRA